MLRFLCKLHVLSIASVAICIIAYLRFERAADGACTASTRFQASTVNTYFAVMVTSGRTFLEQFSISSNELAACAVNEHVHTEHFCDSKKLHFVDDV